MAPASPPSPGNVLRSRGPSALDSPGCLAAPGRSSSVSAAFWQHLRRLGLQDFPCGLGSWNRSRWDARKGRAGLGTEPAGQEEDVLAEETPEVLLELLRDPHSPWAPPAGCSPQEQQLREATVLLPELIHSHKVFQLLSSLRVVGKGVEEVDGGLLQFQQLEELILSANQISRVTLANLPRTLKVLELCGNAVADLQDLCARPPPELQHLGLGYNRLCSPLQEKVLTADLWPNLISLDLSFNNLTDLLGLVSQLSSLQKLQILVLQGNSLALIPTYRGFLVDSLPRLSVLDDTHIGPDERHRFQGLARQAELTRSEARVAVSVGKITGVPHPSSQQQLKVESVSPVITSSYHVTYEFVEGEELEGGSSAQVTKAQEDPVVATLDVSSAQHTGEEKGQQGSTGHSAKVFVTSGKPWADTIDCSYRKEHIVKDLVGLKSYLMAGTTVSVVEEKILSWPVDADPEENRVPKGKAGRGQQKDTAKGAVSRDKQKKNTKKKEMPRELRSDPPIYRTLGTKKVTLEALLGAEDLVCDSGVLISEQPLQPPSLEETDRKNGKDKPKKPKAEKESQASRKTKASAEEMHGEPQVPQPAPSEARNRSQSTVTHEETTPTPGKRKTKDSAKPGEGGDLQPVPLTVQFQMQLLRWPSAAGTQSQERAGETQ